MIVVSVLEATADRVIEAARASAADVVEVRLDGLVDPAPEPVLARIDAPVVVTCRRRVDGGRWSGEESARVALLERALRAGARYVDVELDSAAERLVDDATRDRILLSWHAREGELGTGAQTLWALHERMRRSGAAVVKLVPRAARLGDGLAVRELLRRARRVGTPTAAFAMGAAGLPTRVLAGAWGSWATYGSARRGREAAPGQVPADELRELYRADSLGGDVHVFGIAGHPLGHSLSPWLHNAAFAELGAAAVYVPMPSPDFEDFLTFFAAVDGAGASVTLPHKGAAFAAGRPGDDDVRAIGAANTLVREADELVAYNTDVEGAVAPLGERIELEGRRAAVVGAGGAARAVAYGLRRSGAEVTVFNRTAARARQLAEELGVAWAPLDRLDRSAFELLVNATSVGMAPATDATPVAAAWLHGALVYDLVYNPTETRLLREAAARGIATLGGLEMLIRQAALQLRLFTGRSVPLEVLRLAARRGLTALGRG